jgi:hypothetical protein
MFSSIRLCVVDEGLDQVAAAHQVKIYPWLLLYSRRVVQTKQWRSCCFSVASSSSHASSAAILRSDSSRSHLTDVEAEI